MSFNRILSGFLFIAVFQQLLLALSDPLSVHFISAVILVVLATNDVLYIVYLLVYRRAFDYTIRDAVFEIVTFFLFSLAVVALNPGKNFFHDALFPEWPLSFVKGIESWFWIILAAYWFAIILWTKYAKGGYPDNWPDSLVYMSLTVAILFCVEAAIVQGDSAWLKLAGAIVCFLYLCFYLVWRAMFLTTYEADAVIL